MSSMQIESLKFEFDLSWAAKRGCECVKWLSRLDSEKSELRWQNGHSKAFDGSVWEVSILTSDDLP